MRRSVASPEAETMSYWPPPPPPPVRIRETISFDEPASLSLILQPVCCSNGLRQLAWAYPGHSIRLSLPSPLPIEVGRFEALVEVVFLLLEPQPAAVSASAPVRSATAPQCREIGRASCRERV